MGELFKIHILNDNSAQIWSNLLVSEVTLVPGVHPGELILTLLTVSMHSVLVITELADLVSDVRAVAAVEGVQDPDVLLEVPLGVHHERTLVTWVVMLLLLVLLNVLFLVKHLGALLTIDLMHSLQVILQLGIRFKSFMTIITFEQMIHHVHGQQVLGVELLVAFSAGLPVLRQLVCVQFRDAGETFATIFAHVCLDRTGRSSASWDWTWRSGDDLLR